MTIKSLIKSVSSIQEDAPNVRQFHRLETKILAEVELYEKANKDFYAFILSKNASLGEGKEFQAELNRVSVFIEDAFSIIDKYNAVIELKKLDPKPPPPVQGQSDAFQALLKSLDSSNRKMAEAVEKSGKLKIAPKPMQPTFDPKNDNSDYGEYRIFRNKFNFFVRDVDCPKEKLAWLQHCCKGSALATIGGLSLVDPDFDIACAILDRKYKNIPCCKTLY